MKTIKLVVITLFIAVSISNTNAQDENNLWVIGFGINSVDQIRPTNDVGLVFEDLFGLDEQLDNLLPSISRFSVDRYLGKGFTLQLAGSINKLDNLFGDGNTPSQATTDADAFYYAIDLVAKYDLNLLFGQTGWFDPYISLGGGYQSIDHERTDRDVNGRSDATFVMNLGFNTWFNEDLGLNFQTGYGYLLGEATGYNIFKHSLGLVIRFGETVDTDGDSISDKLDNCPDVAGLKEFKGCPDTDGDGVKDSDDVCPNTEGLATMNGCPDADSDGIADKNDMCPNAKGIKVNKGCPDSDKDGIIDREDKCINTEGVVANNGCPWPDTDGDSVLDKDDKCPTVAGVPSERGCPEKVITKVAKEAIQFAAKSIFFNSSRTSFKSGVTKTLNAMVAIMIKFPKAKFAIEGHTDGDGKASTNLKLSNNRANAVRKYFISKGVVASRLTAKGFGESVPIASNKTSAGKAKNRRVLIKVTNENKKTN